MILKPYKVKVSFKNDGTVYGAEEYTVLAKDEDQAKRKALTNATASKYDDERIPERRMYVTSCEPLDDDLADVA